MVVFTKSNAGKYSVYSVFKFTKRICYDIFMILFTWEWSIVRRKWSWLIVDILIRISIIWVISPVIGLWVYKT